LNTPSLRLEESNANLTPNFYIDRDIPHQTVEETLNLIGLPNKLALYRRENIFLTLNPVQRRFDGSSWLIHSSLH
jgi:hypothetical protein